MRRQSFIIYPLLCALWILGSTSLWPTGPFDEVGQFYTQTFTPQDYGAHEQNWAIVRDKRGLLYFGNGDGVLEFDGVSWRLIPTKNGSAVRSLAVDSIGRIFVGAIGDIGYLAPDKLGQLQYVSLVKHIAIEDRSFEDVWNTHTVSEGTYFQTEKRLFRWRNGRIDVWQRESGFHTGFSSGDTFYVTDTQTGTLLRIDEDELRPVFRGPFLAHAIVRLSFRTFFAVTKKHGILRCQSHAPEAEVTCQPYAPELTETLAELEPYCVAILLNRTLVIGTRNAGLVLIDREGRLTRILNEESGLRSNKVRSILRELPNGLWLGLDDGIARIEITPQISYFDPSNGLPANLENIARHEGHLYLASSNSPGIDVLSTAGKTTPRFTPVIDSPEHCRALASTSVGLLAGCQKAVYQIGKPHRVWESAESNILSMHRSRQDPTQVYVGLDHGLTRLILIAGEWRDGGRFTAVTEPIQTMAEDTQGRLWLGTPSQGILRLEAGASLNDASAVRRYGPADGLPTGSLEVRPMSGQIKILATEDGQLFKLDADAERFVPDRALFAGPSKPMGLREDPKGQVWIAAGQDSVVARLARNGSYQFEPTALRRVDSNITGIYAERAAVWFLSPERLVRMVASPSTDHLERYPAWIRRITSDGSSLYGGAPRNLYESPSWPYANNSLRFSFAAPRFDAPDQTQFRTRLDGLDDEWSSWSRETSKEYADLREGRYTFRIQARDIYGAHSQEDRFTFQILRPWYRSGWVHGLSVLALWWIILEKRSRREKGSNE